MGLCDELWDRDAVYSDDDYINSSSYWWYVLLVPIAYDVGVYIGDTVADVIVVTRNFIWHKPKVTRNTQMQAFVDNPDADGEQLQKDFSNEFNNKTVKVIGEFAEVCPGTSVNPRGAKPGANPHFKYNVDVPKPEPHWNDTPKSERLWVIIEGE